MTLTFRKTFWTLAAALLIAACPLAAPAQDKDDAKADAADPVEAAKQAVADIADKAKPSPDKVGWLELSGSLMDGPAPMSFGALGGSGGPTTLRGTIAKIQLVADNPAYRGLVIRLDGAALSQSQIYELDQAIKSCKVAGKKVVVFAEAYSLGTYMMACSASQILLQKKGMIEMTGIGGEEMYLAGLLAKIGMKADMVQVGKYKGAADQLTLKNAGKEWSENFDNLLDDMYDQVLTRIARSRGLDKKDVEKAMAESWTMSDADYVKRGLVDKVVDRNLTKVTERIFGKGFVWDTSFGKSQQSLNANNPFAMFQMLLAPPPPSVRRDSIALVYANGAIMSGKSSGGGLFGGQTVGSKTFNKALKECRDNPLVKGVVIRINSPGGSALASEVMWQAITELRKTKPVYVSLGPLAASGGYYLACAGQTIYASPQTIVGSIGVVGGKITMGGTYKMLDIGITRRSRGPLGDMFNSVEPFTPEQRKLVRAAMERIYDQFTDRVMQGRGNRVTDIAKVAQGRLFTGQQAIANGLVDQLGGVDAALGDMAARTGLEAGKYDVVTLPRPPSFADMLDQMMSLQAPVGAQSPLAAFTADQSALLRAARAALGEQKWNATQNTLNGLMLLRNEPALTLMPTVVTVE